MRLVAAAVRRDIMVFVTCGGERGGESDQDFLTLRRLSQSLNKTLRPQGQTI